MDWLVEVLGSGAVAAALLAIAGWLGRTQISAWLNRDLERVKAQHQRELEAYKVSLIATAERSKADAEVRKSIALRTAEKRFACLDELQKATLGNAIDFLHVVKMDTKMKTAAGFDELSTRLDALRNAFRSTEIFLTAGERMTVMKYRGVLAESLKHCIQDSPTLVGADFKDLESRMLSAEVDVDHLLRKKVEEMMQMN